MYKRQLYFALAAVIERFRYLKPALAVVLIFIGSKIFVADLLGWEKFPPALSPVSYTHLDVYKRQAWIRHASRAGRPKYFCMKRLAAARPDAHVSHTR